MRLCWSFLWPLETRTANLLKSKMVDLQIIFSVSNDKLLQNARAVDGVCCVHQSVFAMPIWKGKNSLKLISSPLNFLPTEAVCHRMNLAILKSEIWLPEDSRSDSYCWLQETWIFQPKWCIKIRLVFPPIELMVKS